MQQELQQQYPGMILGPTLSFGGTPVSSGRALSASTRYVPQSGQPPGPPVPVGLQQPQTQQQHPPGTPSAGGMATAVSPPAVQASAVAGTPAAPAGSRSIGGHGTSTSTQVPPVLVKRLNSQGSTSALPAFAQPLVQTTTGTAAAPRTKAWHDNSTIGTGGPPEEALHREVEALRNALRSHDEHLQRLQLELKTSRENEGKLSSEVEMARSEIERLAQEILNERAARERAEAAAFEQQRVLQQTPGGTRTAGEEMLGSGLDGGISISRKTGGGGSAGRRDATSRSRRTREGGSGDPHVARHLQSSAVPASSRIKNDEIEPRLREFLEKSKCNLIFRQLNRGWYSFRRADDGRNAEERSVEVSIVNGKLMVTMQPSTHEAGWNNGKPGPIERFVAKHSEE